MNPLSIIDVIIPAYNEETSIGLVIRDLPKKLIRHIIVCNNMSSDNTALVAKDLGAVVIDSFKKGYGTACLSGINYIKSLELYPDIIVFLDGDYSDFPDKVDELVGPIVKEDYDLVIGSRALGSKESGSMTLPQIFGNWLATSLIRLFYNYSFTDLGPFRAIKFTKLIEMDMVDQNFGWTVEMQIKAAKLKLKCVEIPVNYRRRIGKSKVSGTVKGTFMAGYKILFTIFKYI